MVAVVLIVGAVVLIVGAVVLIVGAVVLTLRTPQLIATRSLPTPQLDRSCP